MYHWKSVFITTSGLVFSGSENFHFVLQYLPSHSKTRSKNQFLWFYRQMKAKFNDGVIEKKNPCIFQLGIVRMQSKLSSQTYIQQIMVACTINSYAVHTGIGCIIIGSKNILTQSGHPGYFATKAHQQARPGPCENPTGSCYC